MVDNFLGLQLVSPGSNILPFLRGYFLYYLGSNLFVLYDSRIGIRPLTTNFLRCIEITPRLPNCRVTEKVDKDYLVYT